MSIRRTMTLISRPADRVISYMIMLVSSGENVHLDTVAQESFISILKHKLENVFQIQVFCQPIFGFVEARCSKRWPESKFISTEHPVPIPFCGVFNINFFRMAWRTAYVIVTAVVAMILPFFNDFLGLIGAASFYPLTVYFPIEMYIARTKIPKFSFTWVWLKILSWVCLVVSLVAAAGSIQGLASDLKTYKPFKNVEG